MPKKDSKRKLFQTILRTGKQYIIVELTLNKKASSFIGGALFYSLIAYYKYWVSFGSSGVVCERKR
jgi:hypothetical protein